MMPAAQMVPGMPTAATQPAINTGGMMGLTVEAAQFENAMPATTPGGFVMPNMAALGQAALTGAYMTIVTPHLLFCLFVQFRNRFVCYYT